MCLEDLPCSGGACHQYIRRTNALGSSVFLSNTLDGVPIATGQKTTIFVPTPRTRYLRWGSISFGRESDNREDTARRPGDESRFPRTRIPRRRFARHLR